MQVYLANLKEQAPKIFLQGDAMKLAHKWACLGKKRKSWLSKTCLFLESKPPAYPNNKSVKSTRGNPLKIHRLAIHLDRGLDQIEASQDGVSKIRHKIATRCSPTPKQFIRIFITLKPKRQPFNRSNSALQYKTLRLPNVSSNLVIIYSTSRIRSLRYLQSHHCSWTTRIRQPV